jgi:hypothetical protein
MAPLRNAIIKEAGCLPALINFGCHRAENQFGSRT